VEEGGSMDEVFSLVILETDKRLIQYYRALTMVYNSLPQSLSSRPYPWSKSNKF